MKRCCAWRASSKEPIPRQARLPLSRACARPPQQARRHLNSPGHLPHSSSPAHPLRHLGRHALLLPDGHNVGPHGRRLARQPPHKLGLAVVVHLRSRQAGTKGEGSNEWAARGPAPSTLHATETRRPTQVTEALLGPTFGQPTLQSFTQRLCHKECQSHPGLPHGAHGARPAQLHIWRQLGGQRSGHAGRAACPHAELLQLLILAAAASAGTAAAAAAGAAALGAAGRADGQVGGWVGAEASVQGGASWRPSPKQQLR